jgi:hypothetical protein
MMTYTVEYFFYAGMLPDDLEYLQLTCLGETCGKEILIRWVKLPYTIQSQLRVICNASLHLY